MKNLLPDFVSIARAATTEILMAHDVFISYAMEDKPIADALHKMSFNPTNASWWIRSKCYLPNEFDPLEYHQR